MPSNVTEDEAGKPVVQGDETVGRVVEVDDGTAYVEADPSLADTVKTKLGWTDREDEDTYPLRDDVVADVTEDEIRLRDEL